MLLIDIQKIIEYLYHIHTVKKKYIYIAYSI